MTSLAPTLQAFFTERLAQRCASPHSRRHQNHRRAAGHARLRGMSKRQTAKVHIRWTAGLCALPGCFAWWGPRR